LTPPGAGDCREGDIAARRGRPATPNAARSVRWRRLLLRALLTITVTVIALVAAAAGFLLSLPGVADAPQRVATILAEHHSSPTRRPLPGKLAAAVVAVEDEHFYANPAIDVLDGAGRAAVAALSAGGDPGGSTIAQQLAGELYGRQAGLGGTLTEIGVGVKLALTYPRTQILDMYLNVVYYGNGYWGAAAAARGYFGTSANALDWAQAALLAGLPQAPSAYDPKTHLALAKARQRHVLDQLVANHLLTTAQASAAYREPLRLRQHPAS